MLLFAVSCVFEQVLQGRVHFSVASIFQKAPNCIFKNGLKYCVSKRTLLFFSPLSDNFAYISLEKRRRIIRRQESPTLHPMTDSSRVWKTIIQTYYVLKHTH